MRSSVEFRFLSRVLDLESRLRLSVDEEPGGSLFGVRFNDETFLA